MLALGWSVLPARRWLGCMTLGAGIIGLIGAAYFLAGKGLPGLSEQIADYPSTAMVVVLGVALLVAVASGGEGWSAVRAADVSCSASLRRGRRLSCSLVLAFRLA